MDYKKIIKSKYFMLGILIVGFTLLDQITKLIAYNFQDSLRYENVIFIKHLLEFSYTENPDASLGLLGGVEHKELIFVLVTIIALGMFGYLSKDVDFKTKRVYSYSMVLFFAGTLGNAIDRLFRGFVIDFLHFPFFDFLYRVGLSNFDNNIADILLFFAIFMFAIDLFFFETKRLKEKKEIKDDTINQD